MKTNLTTITFKLDPNLKEQFYNQASKLGLDMTTILILLIKKFISNNKLDIPLEI